MPRTGKAGVLAARQVTLPPPGPGEARVRIEATGVAYAHARGAKVLMLAHFGILYIWYQPALGELNPLTARWELTAGRVALVCFGALILSSELRKRIGLEYHGWRVLHIALAVTGTLQPRMFTQHFFHYHFLLRLNVPH